MLAFPLGALRAIVEMLLYCLLGQAVLYLLAGKRRASNPIYQLLALITRPPRQICAHLLPSASSPGLVAGLCGAILLVLWLFLSWLRKFH